MKRPIFLKLFISYLLLILVLSGVILAFVFRSYSSHAVETSTANLRKLGLALEYLAGPMVERGSLDELNALARKVESDIQVRVTVIDPAGRVLADSEHRPATMENHLDRPEVKAALSGAEGSAIRYSITLGHDLLYVALPMKSAGGTAVIRMSVPVENIDPLLRKVKKHTFEIAAMIICSSLLVALFFAHVISTPVRELSRASKRIAGGDFSVRVKLQGADEIRELAGSFNDMAEKLQKSFFELSKGKEELEGIISSMAEELFVVDEDGRIVLANRSARALTGAGDPTGRHYWELIRSPKLNALADRGKAGPVADELELGGLTYLCSVTPLRVRMARIILLHDITGMKRLEQIKKDLVVNVSHELRTPLTAIKGFTETLLEESAGSGREYLEIIKRHTDRLMNLIGDLLDLSELEDREPRLSFESVDLAALLETVLATFGPRIREKGLEVRVETAAPGLLVRGDPFRLEQLFSNLVDNAVKYTERGSITVSLGRSGGSATVRVADTGIGIPKEHLERIFERFYVVDKSRSRRLGGTGLGLSIVKHIAGLHNGAVTVSSTPSGGTAFTVTLPLGA